ncbi:hypothetical protein N0V90_004731 [Kalmusia sp. IMI 367209]|nr:hypothetical protein N0V90_004731 [Kalmusia sp. IMI 367209]
MLSIDDSSNGWRELILPIALEDEVVMDAVVTASAYHVSANFDAALSLGPSSFTKAVDGLMKRQDFKSLKPLTNGFSVIAILVLLVSVMVTGCSDFPVLFKMLKSAIEAMMENGGSGSYELDEFLRRQFRKFHTYGEPMHAVSLQNVRSQIEQAYNIYLLRALGNLDPLSSMQLVEQFKRTAEEYPGTTLGHHVLIWATFIVAAESSTQEHRAFLIERLRTFHTISKFENNLKAISLLQVIWENESEPKWTNLLPEMRIFIV